MGPYYDHISLLLWRRRHPLGARAGVKPRAAAPVRSRRSSSDDLRRAISLRQRVLELRKLMDLGQGGELSALGSSQGGRDGRSKRYHR